MYEFRIGLFYDFAFFIQFPHIRSERLILLISNKEGTGKSFLYKLLESQFKGYCIFLDCLDPYLARFNFVNNSKKIIWIDDIFGASLSQTRKLFPKATCKVQQYEKKNETPFTMGEYSELIFTSNQDCALHISPGDRRQLILKASDLKLQDRKFFAQTAAQLENLDIAHAWFTFFKTRDITHFSPNQDPANFAKGETLASCMKKSHMFMRQFFVEDDWFTHYKSPHIQLETWIQCYEIKKNMKQRKGEILLRIEHKRLYLLYKSFVKEMYSCSKPRNSDTFWKELEDMGIKIHPTRLKINRLRKTCVDIYYRDWWTIMKDLYPGLEEKVWSHESNFGQFNSSIKDSVDSSKLGW